jgi:hypothetical protein
MRGAGVDADGLRAGRGLGQEARRPAVAAAEVEDALAGLDLHGLEHLLGDVGVGVLEAVGLPALDPGVEGLRDGCVVHGGAEDSVSDARVGPRVAAPLHGERGGAESASPSRIPGELEQAERLLAGHSGKVREEVVEPISRLEMIQQGPGGDPRSGKHRGATQDLVGTLDW